MIAPAQKMKKTKTLVYRFVGRIVEGNCLEHRIKRKRGFVVN